VGPCFGTCSRSGDVSAEDLLNEVKLGGCADPDAVHDLGDCRRALVIAGSRTTGSDKLELAPFLVRLFSEAGATDRCDDHESGR
jgi:hypothetical protein